MTSTSSSYLTISLLRLHRPIFMKSSHLWCMWGPRSRALIPTRGAPVRAWWKSSCSPAARPIKPPVFTTLSQRESNWELGCTSFLFRCLPGPVSCMSSVRCKETPGAHGRLGMPHNAAFHQLQAICVQSCGEMWRHYWMDGTGRRWVRAETEWGGRKRRMAHKKKRMSTVPFTKHWSRVAAFLWDL